MAVLKIYLKRIINTDANFDQAIIHCRKKLEGYFNDCIRLTDRKLFTSASVQMAVSPQISDMDLLVYIMASRKYSLMPGIFHPEGSGGSTKDYPDGVLSEVFADRAYDAGHCWLTGDDPVDQGKALANYAFHELAHNKWHGFPEAERNKYHVGGTKDNIHLSGGVFIGNLEKPEKVLPTRENLELMAAMIQYPVKQRITRFN